MPATDIAPPPPPTSDQISAQIGHGPSTGDRAQKRRPLRTILGIVLAIALGGFLFLGYIGYRSHPSQNTKTGAETAWITYTSTEGKFRILFPKEPTKDSRQSVVQYVSDDGAGDRYLAQYLRLSGAPTTATFTDTYMRSFIEGLKQGDPNSKVLSQENITFMDHPGVEISMSFPADQTYLKARLVLIESDSYFLGVKSKQAAPAHFDQFIDSFQLL